MTSQEASELVGGQHVQLADARVCSVFVQDTVNQLIQFEFGDGSIGFIEWLRLGGATAVDASVPLTPQPPPPLNLPPLPPPIYG